MSIASTPPPPPPPPALRCQPHPPLLDTAPLSVILGHNAASSPAAAWPARLPLGGPGDAGSARNDVHGYNAFCKCEGFINTATKEDDGCLAFLCKARH